MIRNFLRGDQNKNVKKFHSVVLKRCLRVFRQFWQKMIRQFGKNQYRNANIDPGFVDKKLA